MDQQRTYLRGGDNIIRRLLRFRLYVLFILMTAIAVLIVTIRGVINGYYAEQAALDELKSFRFFVKANSERPWWIPDVIDNRYTRVFERVVQLSVSGSSIDFERGLSLNSRNFFDDHIQLLTRFRSLERLDLSFTDITGKCSDVLVGLPSLKVLDVTGTPASGAIKREFADRKPDCIICQSRPSITAFLHNDQTVTIGGVRGPLTDATLLLTNARRGPDAFGYVPTMYLITHEVATEQRPELINRVRKAASMAGYQKINIE